MYLLNIICEVHSYVTDAFYTVHEHGHKNMVKKVPEKGQGFRQHNESQSHSHAEKSYRDFMDGKAIDTQLSVEKEREVSCR